MSVESVDPSRAFFRLTVLTLFSVLVSTPAGLLWSAESSEKACKVLADKRVEEPLRTIASEYTVRTGSRVSLRFLPVAEVDALVQKKNTECDIGCGTGNLDIELAKRSKFKIIGLDIDPDMRPLFEKRVREAGLQDRLSFVTGDAQDMPFEDDYADVIVSRGTLIFIPDIGKCLREVDRVLKPTGRGSQRDQGPRLSRLTTTDSD